MRRFFCSVKLFYKFFNKRGAVFDKNARFGGGFFAEKVYAVVFGG